MKKSIVEKDEKKMVLGTWGAVHKLCNTQGEGFSTFFGSRLTKSVFINLFQFATH